MGLNIKKLEFETSRGNFVLVDMEQEGILDKYEGTPFEYMLPLKEITEEEASEIVESHYGNMFNYSNNSYEYYLSAKESLHSLLKSKGIHLFKNPEKKNYFNPEDFDQDEYAKVMDSEQKTFYNPYIFKI